MSSSQINDLINPVRPRLGIKRAFTGDTYSFLQRAAIGGGGLLIFTAGGLAWRAWDHGALGKIYEGTAFEP